AAQEEWTVVLFEAPGRVAELLSDLAAVAGHDRAAVVARELTKLHEELRSGKLRELAKYYSLEEPRGEITVVMAGTGVAPEPPDRTDEARARAAVLLADGATKREAVGRLVAELGMARNEAYRLVMEL
ncbi:MAG: 16S rRNA (cytidine(1402)-2'-O)-methyltransferase, partial [Gemmatimonadales bacterium]